MKLQRHRSRQRGWTMLELLIAAGVAAVVGVAIFAFLQTSMFLLAKNLSINLTSNSMRGALDRVEQVLQQGDSPPALIDTAGAAVGTGAAPGVKLDRYVGGPYVVMAPLTGLPASATSLALTRSTNIVSSAPLPRAGDIVRIDGSAATLRPRVVSVVAGPIISQRQIIGVNLSAPLGTPVTFVASTIMTAKLIRNVALIVMPANGCQELRYYGDFDATPDLNDPLKYVVVTDQIGTQPSDVNPFSLTPLSGKNFVNFTLRVRASTYANRLLLKQHDEFNTFARVDTFIRPKANP